MSVSTPADKRRAKGPGMLQRKGGSTPTWDGAFCEEPIIGR